jgi:uncharacterized lipoprotein
MKLFRSFLIFNLLITLTACSYITPSFIKIRDRHYLEARSIPPLRMPPGVSSVQIRNQYPISNRDYPEAIKDVSLVPPGLCS